MEEVVLQGRDPAEGEVMINWDSLHHVFSLCGITYPSPEVYNKGQLSHRRFIQDKNERVAWICNALM